MFCIFNWTLVVYTWFFIKEASTYVVLMPVPEDRVTDKREDQGQVTGRDGSA